MDEQRKRAARVLAYLERRTEANGCTPAEAAQAREKAAEIRARYKVEPDRTESGDLDYLRMNFDDLFREVVGAAFLMHLKILARSGKAKRGHGRKKRRKRQAQAKAIRYRWRG